MPVLSLREARQLMETILSERSLAPVETGLVVDHLLFAEMAGKASHGLFRLIAVAERLQAGKNHGKAAPRLIVDLPAMGLLDAQDHLGLVAGYHATQIAIEKAKSSGVSFVGARNFGGTTGCAGYYARLLAQAGLYGILTMNSYALVCPPGSAQRMVGTNPVAFAIPSASGQDAIIDVSVAEIPYGKMAILQREGKSAPEGTILNKQGQPSTNPQDAEDGALLPMAGHKGFALGFALELLAGPLIGAHAGQSVKGGDGFMVIAIDPSHLGDAAQIGQNVDAFLAELKQAQRLDVQTEILIPGEKSARAWQHAQDTGKITVNDRVYDELCALLKQ